MMPRRITPSDIPATVGYRPGPRQPIFARTPDGHFYQDPEHRDTLAMTTAWFGWTTQPHPASRR